MREAKSSRHRFSALFYQEFAVQFFLDLRGYNIGQTSVTKSQNIRMGNNFCIEDDSQRFGCHSYVNDGLGRIRAVSVIVRTIQSARMGSVLLVLLRYINSSSDKTRYARKTCCPDHCS